MNRTKAHSPAVSPAKAPRNQPHSRGEPSRNSHSGDLRICATSCPDLRVRTSWYLVLVRGAAQSRASTIVLGILCAKPRTVSSIAADRVFKSISRQDTPNTDGVSPPFRVNQSRAKEVVTCTAVGVASRIFREVSPRAEQWAGGLACCSQRCLIRITNTVAQMVGSTVDGTPPTIANA